MIQINKAPNDRILELGGGSSPNLASDVRVDIRVCYDTNGAPTVDFACDFNEPLPIKDNDFEGVFSQFALEHVSYRKVPQLLSEIRRVLKSGGKAVLVVPNTEAQLKWIQEHQNGWDNNRLFEAASCVLFGDQDYPENTHKCYFSPVVMFDLMQKAGFEQVQIQGYGERDTDMVVVAMKPKEDITAPVITEEKKEEPKPRTSCSWNLQKINPETSREELFAKDYFNGGLKYGGYAGEGYRDFPCHEMTVRHILARKPNSVLELGAARGYIGKRIEDRGISYFGLEISKHCILTSVSANVFSHDICKRPWPVSYDGFDLCFSCAFLEHVPEEFLPDVIKEMTQVSKRGLHGVDFGDKDDGFDKTHVTLHSKNWWQELFAKYAPDYPVEIVDKEELEQGEFPPEVLGGDGKVKLNIGSFTNMFYYGWTNIDIHDLQHYANQWKYRFQRADIRNGIPFGTESVDFIFSSHFLEHLTYDEGLRFLKECRRVIKPDGIIRLTMPDAETLMFMYAKSPGTLSKFDEINDNAEKAKTPAGKLWALLHDGHQACYDMQTLLELASQAGLKGNNSGFRSTVFGVNGAQILRETTEMFSDFSLFAELYPIL